MADKKIALAEASEAQLRTFAEDYLGMTFPANTKVETLRAKIKSAWTKDEISVADAAPEEPLVGQAPPTPKGQEIAPGKVKIIIQRTDDSGGDEPVPIGVNGKVMLVPRGEEVGIPMAYFRVLENCVTYRYESLKDGGINPIPRKVPLYPFQRIG